MPVYIARRLAQFVPTFIGATLAVYALAFLVPGDPARALAGEQASDPAAVALIQQRYHLNESFFHQYMRYLTGLFHGTLGTTYSGQSVAQSLVHKAGVTITLAGFALLFEILVGVSIGVFAAVRDRTVGGNGAMLFTLVVLAIPIFVSCLVMQLVLTVRFHLFPTTFVAGNLTSYILPAIALGSISVAPIARLTRSATLASLQSDYVRSARAHGLSERRVIFHALRNSLIPTVTHLGYDFGMMLSGAVVVEGVFNLPGVGNALFQAITLKDGPTIVGIVTALVVAYLFINLVVDLIYGVLDPRIRAHGN
ncbi:ABC transporter permease [Actinoallomurus iriomotensis]|uniref:Peptide ABC transporter n=1 Tax=Actinoallomurus iriomotensis TaxID=478107 RepID=A0A9W6RUN2_9ACTN|nr:ABC transporter permease [Actinoallomurus iriomotensis]GLY82140.1 peptide ABC transporter [Actinoallomurus iriomotensis]